MNIQEWLEGGKKRNMNFVNTVCCNCHVTEISFSVFADEFVAELGPCPGDELFFRPNDINFSSNKWRERWPSGFASRSCVWYWGCDEKTGKKKPRKWGILGSKIFPSLQFGNTGAVGAPKAPNAHEGSRFWTGGFRHLRKIKWVWKWGKPEMSYFWRTLSVK